MIKKDALHELIRSLSPGEKRYFTRYVKFYTTKSVQEYCALFAILDNMAIYNEAQIKQKLKNKTFGENLSVSKNYLYNQILRSLRSYHRNNKSIFQLYDLIEDIYLLLDKNLTQQAMKRIHKAKKLAQKYQYDQILLEVLRLERVIIRGYSQKESKTQIEENQKRTTLHLKQLNLKFDIMQLYDDIYFILRNKSSFKNPKEAVEKLMKTFSGKAENTTLSFDTKMVYHLIWVNYYAGISNEPDNAKLHMKIVLDTFEKSPNLIEEYPLRYINVVNNYLNLFYLQNDFSVFKQYIGELDKMKAASEYIKVKLFQTIYYLKFLELLGKFNYQKATSIIPQVEKGLKIYKKEIDKNFQLEFFQNLAIIHFFNKDYNAAFAWTKQVIKEKKHEIRQDVRIFCRTLNYIMYYENGDFEMAYNTAHALSRYLDKQKTDQQFYQIMATRFLKIINTPNRKEREQLLRNLKIQLSVFPGYINGKKEILFWLGKG